MIGWTSVPLSLHFGSVDFSVDWRTQRGCQRGLLVVCHAMSGGDGHCSLVTQTTVAQPVVKFIVAFFSDERRCRLSTQVVE